MKENKDYTLLIQDILKAIKNVEDIIREFAITEDKYIRGDDYGLTP